jgi:hypothetical protein
MSSIGKRGATGDAAGVLFKNFQTRNSSPINTKVPLDRATVDRVFTPQYRATRRSDYYGAYTPMPTTQYRNAVYTNHSSGYGIWDLMLFNSIMDNVGDRGMYYHHQQDPAFQQWRTDANSACAAGDTDVCEKLKDLDREMSEYKAKGTVVNPAYVTPGVDPDIYEANNIDPSKLAEIKVCTGAVGSDYLRYQAEIAKFTKLRVTPVTTNGSVDTIAKMATGECNIGFVQTDISLSPSLQTLVTLSQLEVGLLICNKESNIKTAADMKKDTVVYIGNDQTGSQYTFGELQRLSGSLGKAVVNNTLPALQAAEVVQSQPQSCFFAVSTPEYPGFMSLDRSGKAYGVPILSKHLSKNQPYKLVVADVKHYKTLTQEEYKSYNWFNTRGTDTIAVPTALVAPQSWIDQNKDLYNLLLLEKTKLQAAIQ